MCTLTYIPLEGDRYLLTSNRDEAPHRAGAGILIKEVEDLRLAYPPDATAGGSWLAVGVDGRAACLLNGAWEQHDRKPPYRMSRGQMVLQYFDYAHAAHFAGGFAFGGMEPFTLVVFERGDIFVMRWDGRDVDMRQHDASRCHIWASPMLYTRTWRRKRAHWFADWLEGRQQYHREAILHFHLKSGEGDPWNDLVMNRNNMVRTVGVTSIVREKDAFDLHYRDLMNATDHWAKLDIHSGQKRIAADGQDE